MLTSENPRLDIHPTALVDGSAELADGVAIGPYAIVGPGVVMSLLVGLGSVDEFRHRDPVARVIEARLHTAGRTGTAAERTGDCAGPGSCRRRSIEPDGWQCRRYVDRSPERWYRLHTGR
jgi:hypothetical protein